VLTGIPAGEQLPDGRWPEGTINARVDARLTELVEAAQRYGRRAVPGDTEEETAP
jgi:hypothetical protein